MSSREKIDKWSLPYALLQSLVVAPLYRFYYSKIQSEGWEKVPRGEAVIFAPNHQNALMDALTFVGTTNTQTVFLARADIFRNRKLIVEILTFIKILPIYRIRDGLSELQKNDEIFELTQKVLRNKSNPLCLFPEGNHGDRRRLRPLVKGIFRIAFRAQGEKESTPFVKIVPVGIDYGHYQKFRHTLFIKYGDPIEVSDYWSAYEENPSVAMNQLRDKLAEEMKKVMIHIESEEYYTLYMFLREALRKKICHEKKIHPGNLAHRYRADKEIIARLDRCLNEKPELLADLKTDFSKFEKLRDKLRFRNWVPSHSKYSIIVNALGIILSLPVLPLVLLGVFNNWPNLFLPVRFGKRIKDTQFRATAIWGAASAMTIIYYPILAILALIFLPFWWIKAMYIITLPSSGVFAFNYRNFLIRSWARIRYSWRFGQTGSENRRLHQLYKDIVKKSSDIMDQYADAG